MIMIAIGIKIMTINSILNDDSVLLLLLTDSLELSCIVSYLFVTSVVVDGEECVFSVKIRDFWSSYNFLLFRFSRLLSLLCLNIYFWLLIIWVVLRKNMIDQVFILYYKK